MSLGKKIKKKIGLENIVKKDLVWDKILATKKILQRILEVDFRVLHEENIEKSRLNAIQKKAQEHLENLSRYTPFKSICTYTHIPIGLRKIITFAEKENKYYSPEYFKELMKAELKYINYQIENQLKKEIIRSKKNENRLG